MTSHWKAFLGVVLIYIFGCFSGAVSTSIFYHHKMLGYLQHPALAMSAVSAALEKRMTGNLNLDENQKQQVHQFFEENLHNRIALQKEMQPQIHDLYRQTFQQVAAILHPDQADLFHQNIENFHNHFGLAAFRSQKENPVTPVVSSASPSTNSGAANPPDAP